jgi:hypothetical protein
MRGLTFKESARNAIGAAICDIPFFSPLKKYLFTCWPDGPRGPLFSLYGCALNYWLGHAFLAESDPGKRELLKKDFMGGNAGAEWAAEYLSSEIDPDRKIGGMRADEAEPFLKNADAFLKSEKFPALVAQIGCSSGKEIAWLARRNPNHRFIGTDIYPEVVEFCRREHHAKNLEFAACSALALPEMLAPTIGDSPLIVLSSGSLQYVQPEHLDSMFKSFARTPPPHRLYSDGTNT